MTELIVTTVVINVLVITAVNIYITTYLIGKRDGVRTPWTRQKPPFKPGFRSALYNRGLRAGDKLRRMHQTEKRLKAYDS